MSEVVGRKDVKVLELPETPPHVKAGDDAPPLEH